MKKTLAVALAFVATVGLADDPVAASANTTAIPMKKVAVFVQNRTREKAFDDEADGIRDRLAASLAAVEGFDVVDSALVADTFRRYKVNVEEEKKGLVSGIFSGGSIPNVARMLNCDYVCAASIVGASAMRRSLNGQPNTVYTLRMAVKVMDASGATVGSVPNWSNTFPVLNEAGDDPMNYYNILIDRWVEDATNEIAANALKWRKPTPAVTALVSFKVTTSIDKVVTELESQTRGTKGELLADLRKVVGGATVEIDGAVMGTAPGEFRASPGLHQLKISRQWMQTYTATVNVQDGMQLDIALELSEAGLVKWGTAEAIRADVAKRYGEAALERGVKLNVDTSNWRDGVLGGGAVVPHKVKISD